MNSAVKSYLDKLPVSSRQAIASWISDKSNHDRLVEFIHHQTNQPLVDAAKHGIIPIVDDLLKNAASKIKPATLDDAFTAAAEAGYSNVLKLFHRYHLAEVIVNRQNNDLFDLTALYQAVMSNHLDIVQWLIELGATPSVHELEAAVAVGNLNEIEYFIELGIEVSDDVIEKAIQYGQTKVLDLLDTEEYSDLFNSGTLFEIQPSTVKLIH